MTKVISIGTDRNLFKKDSAVSARQREYGALFDELHIIVFTSIFSKLPSRIQIAPNVWVYGTRSLFKIFHIRQAFKVASRIISENNLSKSNTVVTTQDPFETALVGIRIKNKFSIPLHVQIHTDFLSPYFCKNSFLNRIRQFLAKKNLHHANAVRVVSKRISESLKQAGIVLAPGLEPLVLPIYVDTTLIENAPISIDLKKKYPQFNFIILLASRLEPEKNIPNAIEIFSKVLSVYPRSGLVIVGSGSEVGRIRSLVAKMNLQNSVVFEPWQDNIYSYFKTANLFILTSYFEGYGLSLVESIVAHCPAVSSDVGVASQLLHDGQTSPVCPVGDTLCFADIISKMIENPGLRDHVVFESRSRLNSFMILDKEEHHNQYKKNIESALGR